MKAARKLVDGLVTRAEKAEANVVDLQRQLAEANAQLDAVRRWWSEHFDCSRSPGHPGFPL